jgi:hypothetical protein
MKGWKLIMVVQYADESYMPLDERTLARAWDRCGRKYTNGFKQYWALLEAEQDKQYNKRTEDRRQLVRDMAGDQWDSQRIMVGYGKSSGSKFSKHHAGG